MFRFTRQAHMLRRFLERTRATSTQGQVILREKHLKNLWLSTIAHNNLLDTGRIGDWGSHRIEHELSGQYGITHGEGMAIVLPAWIRYVAKVKPWKLAQLNVRVFDGDAFTLSEEENALQLAQTLENFFEYLGLKTRLNELNITDEHFDLMAKRATRNGTIGHYIPLDEGSFIGILKLAI